MKRFACFAFFAVLASAQIPPAEVNQMCDRLAELMDAGGIAIPELRRPSEPVIATVKQGCSQLQQRPAAGQPSFAVLTNARLFLNISDAVPKPYPLPDVARDQLREIRDLTTRFEAHFRALLDQKDAELRSPDRDSALRYSEENRLVPPPKQLNRRVVFLGDSVTAQWRFNQYFPDEDYLNRGINAQLTGQLLTRMKSDVLDLKPAVVVIQGGNFDLARDVPLDLIADNVQLMADIAAANSIKVVIASALPGSPQVRALNDWLKSFAAQRKLAYADLYAAVVDVPEVSDDGLVPNSKGYRLLAPVLGRALDQTLKPTPPPPAPTKPKPPVKK
jgi:hypothetical protein